MATQIAQRLPHEKGTHIPNPSQMDDDGEKMSVFPPISAVSEVEEVASAPVTPEMIQKMWSQLKSREGIITDLTEADKNTLQRIVDDSDAFSRRAIEFVKIFFKNRGDLEHDGRYHMRRLGGARVFLDKADEKTVFVVACDKDEEDFKRISRRLHEMKDIANAGSPCQAHTVMVDTFGCTFFISEISKDKLYSASMAPVEEEKKPRFDLLKAFCTFLLAKKCESFAQLITGSMKLLGIPLKDLKLVAAEVKRQNPSSPFVSILEDEVFLSSASDILSRNLRFVSLQSESSKREVIARFLSALTVKTAPFHDKLWDEISRNACAGCSFETMFKNPRRCIGLVDALMSKQKICLKPNIIHDRIMRRSLFEADDITDFRFNVQELALVSRARGLIHAYKAAHSSDPKVKVGFQNRAVGAFFQAFETYALNNSHFLECEKALEQLYLYKGSAFDGQRFREFNSLRCFAK